MRALGRMGGRRDCWQRRNRGLAEAEAEEEAMVWRDTARYGNLFSTLRFPRSGRNSGLGCV